MIWSWQYMSTVAIMNFSGISLKQIPITCFLLIRVIVMCYFIIVETFLNNKIKCVPLLYLQKKKKFVKASTCKNKAKSCWRKGNGGCEALAERTGLLRVDCMTRGQSFHERTVKQAWRHGQRKILTFSIGYPGSLVSKLCKGGLWREIPEFWPLFPQEPAQRLGHDGLQVQFLGK